MNLEKYKGKTVLRYTYELKDTEEPTYVTLLIYKNRIVGGDVTGMGNEGFVMGLEQYRSPENDLTGEETSPEDSSAESSGEAN